MRRQARMAVGLCKSLFLLSIVYTSTIITRVLQRARQMWRSGEGFRADVRIVGSLFLLLLDVRGGPWFTTLIALGGLGGFSLECYS
jgi:hypothetical protein